MNENEKARVRCEKLAERLRRAMIRLYYQARPCKAWQVEDDWLAWYKRN